MRLQSCEVWNILLTRCPINQNKTRKKVKLLVYLESKPKQNSQISALSSSCIQQLYKVWTWLNQNLNIIYFFKWVCMKERKKSQCFFSMLDTKVKTEHLGKGTHQCTMMVSRLSAAVASIHVVGAPSILGGMKTVYTVCGSVIFLSCWSWPWCWWSGSGCSLLTGTSVWTRLFFILQSMASLTVLGLCWRMGQFNKFIIELTKEVVAI